MLSLILRSLTSILILCFATSAMANDAFIYYKNSGSDATTSQYNNLKREVQVMYTERVEDKHGNI